MIKQQIGEWTWYDFAELSSTNDWVMEQNVSENIICTAQCQTKGRGRRGRSWVSPLGNLYMSQLFFSAKSPSEMVYLCSLSIAETIENFSLQYSLQIKWPNDILVDGKKVCGILIEKNSFGVYVIGIGVNLISNPKTADVSYPATNLADCGIKVTREEFIKAYISRFAENLQRSSSQIKDLWLAKAYHLNEEITIGLAKEKVSGRFIGIDEQGFLLLQQGDKTKVINTGEILFL